MYSKFAYSVHILEEIHSEQLRYSGTFQKQQQPDTETKEFNQICLKIWQMWEEGVEHTKD